MENVKLTYEETKKLEQNGLIYALRENAVYLIEKIENEYNLTKFCGSKFKLILTYQKSLDI